MTVASFSKVQRPGISYAWATEAFSDSFPSVPTEALEVMSMLKVPFKDSECFLDVSSLASTLGYVSSVSLRPIGCPVDAVVGVSRELYFLRLSVLGSFVIVDSSFGIVFFLPGRFWYFFEFLGAVLYWMFVFGIFGVHLPWWGEGFFSVPPQRVAASFTLTQREK